MRIAGIIGALLLVGIVGQAGARPARKQTLLFSGYEWRVKSGEAMGPGPNAWNAANVWLDAKKQLHLKIANRDGKWTCAEVETTKRLGFGTYEFQVVGRIDRLDRNIVLGLFNYPTRDVGADGTNEIDIEFARWGYEDAPNGNFTVWPPVKEVKEGSDTFRFTLTDDVTVQRFEWTSQKILFESLRGQGKKADDLLHRWLFQPDEALRHIPQQPLPVLINLWLFGGKAPTDGKEVELVIRRFRFTPAKAGVSRSGSKAASSATPLP